MNLPIQKFMMLFAAAISLLQIPISHANGLDARLRDDMQAKHYEPVANTICSVMLAAVLKIGFAPSKHLMQLRSTILPITHERTGFEGIIGYETHFSGHGHEVHSPFDNHDSKALLISAAA